MNDSINSLGQDTFAIDNKKKELQDYLMRLIIRYGSYKYSNIVEADLIAPSVFDLSQNFPNPWNPTTLITYSLPTSSNVILKVYNVLGKLIKTLVNENQEAGIYKVNFDAGSLSNGVYFYKIQAGNYTETKKMLLLK